MVRQRASPLVDGIATSNGKPEGWNDDVGGTSRGIGDGAARAHIRGPLTHLLSPRGEECHRAMKNLIALSPISDYRSRVPRAERRRRRPAAAGQGRVGWATAYDRTTLRRRHNPPRGVRDTRGDARRIRRSSHGDKEPSHTNSAPRAVRRSSYHNARAIAEQSDGGYIGASTLILAAPERENSQFAVLSTAPRRPGWLYSTSGTSLPLTDKHFRST